MTYIKKQLYRFDRLYTKNGNVRVESPTRTGYKSRGVVKEKIDELTFLYLNNEGTVSQNNDRDQIRDETCTTAATVNAVNSVLDWTLMMQAVGFVKSGFKTDFRLTSWEFIQEFTNELVRGKLGTAVYNALVRAQLIGRGDQAKNPAVSLAVMRLLGAPIRFYQGHGITMGDVGMLIKNGYSVIGIVRYTQSGSRHAICINGVCYDTNYKIRAVRVSDSSFDVQTLERTNDSRILARTKKEHSTGWIPAPEALYMFVDDRNQPRGLESAPCWIVGGLDRTDVLEKLASSQLLIDIDFEFKDVYKSYGLVSTLETNEEIDSCFPNPEKFGFITEAVDAIEPWPISVDKIAEKTIFAKIVEIDRKV